jgi:hypothetical protein
MADRIELFERRNRLRIVALVVLATLNYIVAVVMAAIALGSGPCRRGPRNASPASFDERIDHLRELAGESTPRHAMMLTPPGPTKRPTTMSTTPQMIWRRRSAPIPSTTRITAMSHRMKFMPPPFRFDSN